MGKEPVSAGSGRAGEMYIRFALRNCRLTASPASANVTLIILRVADLAAAALDGHFEHPAKLFLVLRDIQAGNFLTTQNRFSTAC